MKKFAQAAVATTAVLLAGQAAAAVITLEVVDATWVNPVGGQNVNINNGGPGNDSTISWGVPRSTNGQSSYVFDPAAPPATVVNLNQQFDLGEFTHNNFVIGLNTSISSVDLMLTVDLDIDGVDVGDDFTIFLTHNETPNQCGPANCSDDLVTITNATGDIMVEVDGVLYTLSVLGFQQGGNPIVNPLRTVENQINQAQLVAVITAQPVPEPAAVTLLGLGLLGLGGLLRRRA